MVARWKLGVGLWLVFVVVVKVAKNATFRGKKNLEKNYLVSHCKTVLEEHFKVFLLCLDLRKMCLRGRRRRITTFGVFS
jgi:hypothetical protein